MSEAIGFAEEYWAVFAVSAVRLNIESTIWMMVSGEQAMTPGEQVPLTNPDTCARSAPLHHAVGAEVDVDLFDPQSHSLGAGLVNGVEAVRGCLVRTE